MEDESFRLIEGRSEIACLYLKTWFTIDILAITPFELFIAVGTADKSTNANDLIRVVRIGKLYKLVKITRLLRLFKIFKSNAI